MELVELVNLVNLVELVGVSLHCWVGIVLFNSIWLAGVEKKQYLCTRFQENA